MVMNGYVVDDHLRGITFHSQKLADQVGLKQLLERRTGLSFATFLSDRRAAYRLKLAVRDWISTNCQNYLDAFPYEAAEKSRNQVLANATADIYWELVCQEFGQEQAIAVYNKILQDFSIREEFLAEGDAASSRDFSFLLDTLNSPKG